MGVYSYYKIIGEKNIVKWKKILLTFGKYAHIYKKLVLDFILFTIQIKCILIIPIFRQFSLYISITYVYLFLQCILYTYVKVFFFYISYKFSPIEFIVQTHSIKLFIKFNLRITYITIWVFFSLYTYTQLYVAYIHLYILLLL